MVRQSPRRNQRNKGFKVKHALQICLLLAVSIWLLYQVQHSRNKKAAIGESTKISKGLQNGSDIIKLGRKDLQPHVEGSAVEDVRQKEDQEEESQEKVGEEGEHRKDFIDEESETEAQKEETDERKDTDVKKEERDEDREKENKEEAEDGNKESAQEGNDIGKEEVERKEDESKEDGSEGTEEKSSEENLTTEIGDSQDNGSIKIQEKSSEEIVTTENGDSKENGNEETQGKSSEENNSRENGESKENKEGEDKSKEIEDKKLRDEKMIESKATGSEESGETNTDEKTKEIREEKDITVEDSGMPENQVPGRNDGEAAREENLEGEKNVSSEVYRETQNISITEGGITEKSNAGEQIENTEGNQFEEKETKNTEATSVNKYNSTENAIIEKNDSALDSLGNKNGTSLLETEDSSNQTTATTETGGQLKVNDNPTYYDGGKLASDPTSDTSLNQNKMVDNIIPFEDSTQTLLNEQTEKPEGMTAGENSDLNSAPPATTEKKDFVNGESIKSFDNIESVLDEQSAKPSTSNKTQNGYENSTWNEDNDTLQSHTNSEIPGTEEHRELSNENANGDSGQNKTGDFSTSRTVTEKEVSSSPNDNADARKHDEVNSDTSSVPQDEKETSRDPATLPESGTEGNNHEVAAEK